MRLDMIRVSGMERDAQPHPASKIIDDIHHRALQPTVRNNVSLHGCKKVALALGDGKMRRNNETVPACANENT